MKTSIILADDHPLVRRGMRAILEAVPDFAIIGEAGDGLEAKRLVERLHPDVLVLDLNMPGLRGLDVIRAIRQSSPKTRVVMLSMHSDTAFVGEAIKLGARAYVLKDSSEEHLVRAVHECLADRRYLSPPLSPVAIDHYIEQSLAGPFLPHETLTKREREVLTLSVQGLKSSEVAARLHISHRTVENHRANLMRKLEVQNLSELVRYAAKHRLMPLDE